MAFATPADEIVEALATHRWWARDDAVPIALVARLHEALVDHEARGLCEAAIGRGDRRQVDVAIRGDRTRWLSGEDPVERELIGELDRLRMTLNRTAYLGLVDMEAHFASYPPGTCYRRHVDTFRGSDARVLSLVLYLNEAWQPNDGGELVLYAADGDGVLARIAPTAGTLVVFESAALPHEVLPAVRTRRSIAGWFRRRPRRRDASR